MHKHPLFIFMILRWFSECFLKLKLMFLKVITFKSIIWAIWNIRFLDCYWRKQYTKNPIQFTIVWGRLIFLCQVPFLIIWKFFWKQLNDGFPNRLFISYVMTCICNSATFASRILGQCSFNTSLRVIILQ